MKNVFEVKNLCVDYITGGNSYVRAVDNVSFTIKEGQSLGLAGESGCGKSTIAYSLMRLHRPPAIISGGEILFEGKDILKLNDKELRDFRWDDTAMVFQSAMNCLNPVVKLEEQFYEIFYYHNITKNRKEARKRSEELLELVGIPKNRLQDYPHQFSGGMRQRAVIAMALALNPKLLILDEPTTALDTVVQRDILRRIYALKEKFGFAILFITHDISLMMEFCDEVAIMYAGKIVEQASSKNILNNPNHPYAFGLKNSFPSLQGPISYMEGIPGSPLDLKNIPAGCRFEARCFRKTEKCATCVPDQMMTPDGFYYCHHPLTEEFHKKDGEVE